MAMRFIVLTMVLFWRLDFAFAQPHGQPEESRAAALIASAKEALRAGEHERAVSAALKATAAQYSRADRAEGFRVHALATLAGGDVQAARQSFLSYLLLEPDGHLDPALVPPESIALLEDVRAQHAAEIEAMRPKPKTRRYLLLNAVPGAGQFQNGERTKGLLLVSGIGVFLSVNVGTYVWLSRRCSSDDRTCGDGSTDDTRQARSLNNLNIASGVFAIGLYAYSVFDGVRGYYRLEREEQRDRALQWSANLEPGQLGVLVGGRF